MKDNTMGNAIVAFWYNIDMVSYSSIFSDTTGPPSKIVSITGDATAPNFRKIHIVSHFQSLLNTGGLTTKRVSWVML